jgi:uracil-DNA glycosylase
MRTSQRFDALASQIISCGRCPRLVEYRESVRAPPSLANQEWWRKPVPGFGDVKARLLVLGLAPARTGALRTGRIFTGDASSRFLVAALHSAGFANQPTSESRSDALAYEDCYLTAVVKCAPPGDKPLPEEFENCSRFLDSEISLLQNLRAVLALGSFAFKSYVAHLKRDGSDVRGLKFGHGVVYRLQDSPALYASYHPSPRNTNTGKLSKSMLVSVLNRIKRDFSI